MNYTTAKEEHNRIVRCITRDVEAMKAHHTICWRQYMDAKAILSNPNFNNHSIKMLRDLGNRPGNTKIHSYYVNR